MRPTRTALLLLAVLASPAIGQDAPPPDPDAKAAPAAPSPDVTAPPPEAEFVVVPLRAHVLQSAGLPDVDCHLSDADLDRIVGKVNEIWHKAGDSLGARPRSSTNPAARQDQFQSRPREPEVNATASAVLQDSSGPRGLTKRRAGWTSTTSINSRSMAFSSAIGPRLFRKRPGSDPFQAESKNPCPGSRRTNSATLWGCRTARIG